MKQLTEEFISARMETLEEVLRADTEFQQQTKVLHGASHAFKNGCGMTSEGWKLYDEFEEQFTKYNCLYSEEAYRLGFEDAIQVAAEHQLKMKKSVLNNRDIEHMIYLYDAVKKLKVVLLGHDEACYAKDGVLKEFDRIFQVIESGVCSEIAMFGEDDATDKIVSILNNDRVSPKEKAGILTGLQEMDEEV